MRALLDTSVLVPVFYPNHEHHQASLRILTALGRRKTFASLHSLAEVYATLTRMPGKLRATGPNALRFIQSLKAQLTLVVLSEPEFWRVLESAAELPLAGGSIYDALIGECALKAKVDAVYTWNLRHFQLLHPDIAQLVRSPAGDQDAT